MYLDIYEYIKLNENKKIYIVSTIFFLFFQTLLSPVICCGPPGLLLLKPAVLSFEHCASLQHATWSLHLMSCASFQHPQQNLGTYDSNTSSPNSYSSLNDLWTRVLTLGEERIDTPVYTQIDGSQV